ncbi:hypothetical protein [Vibrio sp. 10N.261.55.A7]|uniref:hypothetical protein n=1 Tax=Vibrio sp. 10N.261.55.A7 TaxID=1880851 RepID=UPI000C856514|nr:hypothetical protein [Vibrio sp. 10N.261.55.A7]PMJ98758.1 hypothetical protein BCU12_21580 [Vibrio sp. 10N.261.55.A7]
MNKSILSTVVVALLSAGSVSAEGITGGLEVDYKSKAIQSETYETENSGAKVFVNYGAFGASAKTNRQNVQEYNLNYTHRLEDSNIYLKGEYELVDRTGQLKNINKLGLTVGTTFAETMNASFRFRKDIEATSSSNRSDISRVDLALGNQFENVHFGAKVVGQQQHSKQLVGSGAKDQTLNYEARMTFTGISNLFIPYFELSDEANFQNDKRETFSKVGLVLKF